MRNQLLILSLLICPIANARADGEWVGLKQAREFLAKSKSCELAVARVFDQCQKLGDANVGAEELCLSSSIVCIGNVTLNQGGALQKQGCGQAYLDLKTGKFDVSALEQASSPDQVAFVSGKKCAKGGIDLLLTRPSLVSESLTVKDSFSKYNLLPVPIGKQGMQEKLMVVFTAHPKWYRRFSGLDAKAPAN